MLVYFFQRQQLCFVSPKVGFHVQESGETALKSGNFSGFFAPVVCVCVCSYSFIIADNFCSSLQKIDWCFQINEYQPENVSISGVVFVFTSGPKRNKGSCTCCIHRNTSANALTCLEVESWGNQTASKCFWQEQCTTPHDGSGTFGGISGLQPQWSIDTNATLVARPITLCWHLFLKPQAKWFLIGTSNPEN